MGLKKSHTHSLIFILMYWAADERPLRILFDHQRYVEYAIFKFHGANIVIDFIFANKFYHFCKFTYDR